ncbi:aldo/keto reductase, partial [candidate division KSB1 bacterium]
GLGAMLLSIAGRPDENQAFEVIEAFIDCGGDFIDTANVYCLDNSDLGHNECLIHRALERIGMSDQAIVATKGGLTRPEGRWEVDGRPEWLRTSCEKSLKDLHAEVIELYQLHAVDPRVGLARSLEELLRLKEKDKIRHIGLSNVTKEQIQYALSQTEIASVQNRCNPFHKADFHSGLVDFCARQGISYIPYSPVGGRSCHVRLTNHPLFQALAQKYGASPFCIALAWLLQKGEHILPIPGASRVASVRDNMGAAAITLESEDIAEIDALPDQ